jgi:nicotinate phosphoribosyltransferase
MFHVANPQDIINGKITDVYFERALRILKRKRINPLVKAEFIAKSLPGNWTWGIFAGLEEATSLMKNLPVKVRAMKEGAVFYPYEPVVEIEGRYQDFCVFETALLGFLCQASGIATKAARFKRLAGDRQVISFGARRMHPILAPMIERNAYIGGCDGVAVIKSGDIIGEAPMGTMPHALIICMGSTVAALKAYDDVLEKRFKRVALIDTFLDEKFECMNVAEAFGKKLYAVRFDTPSSRRGDFYRILEECRWELNLRGYEHIKFYVSGGIQEEDIPVLNQFVDGYGIGTSISNAPVIDYSMDIMEVEGNPLAKRSKWSGSKRVLRCTSCGSRSVVPNRKNRHTCSCGKSLKDILIPVLDHGKQMLRFESPSVIRKNVLMNIKKLVLE